MTNNKTTPIEGATTTITKQQRQLKVREGFHSYQLNQWPTKRTAVGEIQLKGHWLVQAGFDIDSNITVNIQHGKLVIQAE